MRRDGISRSVAYITFDIAFHDWSHPFLVEYVVCHSNSKGQIGLHAIPGLCIIQISVDRFVLAIINS